MMSFWFRTSLVKYWPVIKRSHPLSSTSPSGPAPRLAEVRTRTCVTHVRTLARSVCRTRRERKKSSSLARTLEEELHYLTNRCCHRWFSLITRTFIGCDLISYCVIVSVTQYEATARRAKSRYGSVDNNRNPPGRWLPGDTFFSLCEIATQHCEQYFGGKKLWISMNRRSGRFEGIGFFFVQRKNVPSSRSNTNHRIDIESLLAIQKKLI